MIDEERWTKFSNDAKALLEANKKQVEDIMGTHLDKVDSEEDKKFLKDMHNKIQSAMKKGDSNTLNSLMAEIQNHIKA